MIHSFYHRLIRYSACLFPGAIRKAADPNSVALTFDDGPHPEATPRVWDVLDSHELKATFFLLGQRAEKYPELASEYIAKGYSVGSHGYHHGWHIGSRKSIRESVATSKTIIEETTGTAPVLFRPPYGIWLPFNGNILSALEMKLTLWSHMPGDFLPDTDAAAVHNSISKHVRGGDIIVLHDNEKTKDKISDIVEAAIAAIQGKGLTITNLAS